MASRDLEESDSSEVFEAEGHPTDESPLLPKSGRHASSSEEEPLSGANDENLKTVPGTASIISLLLIGMICRCLKHLTPLNFR